ncbi:glycosyl transferase family 2 [Thiorhodococcus drewsii AZ1]|uniref:Glycosyl transferase family 2 n=1 Tax=Thiorhodococcus drewsii AZ1 TaxID=765913 RepID=G2E0Y7_9GAMM|nr:glycosyltransferase family 2 protein [Thiorhodococcus drewsii]EGV31328.1 glycosyl transferase family 2 [Thiorhodococcus drewsii AZ1]
MLNAQHIAVVVPCYNESLLIGRVIETMPAFVDRIFVVDDVSRDETCTIVQGYVDKDPDRLVLIRHAVNQGVGGAIATGYKAARDEGIEVTAVMAGDAQMDPAELESIVQPVLSGEYDYTKGNRLFSGEAWQMIPRVRYLGNAMLSLLTKIASGYWNVADSQSGYTAISLKALRTIDWDQMYRRYGQPNDLLTRLNIYDFRVKDIPIRPIYGIGEKSGIRPLRMIPRLSLLLHRLFWYRMLQKYVIRDFHPLLFFYIAGTVLFPTGFLFGFYLVTLRLFHGPVAATSALFAMFLFMSGLQFLLFAMWMDMEHNRTLR